VSDFVHLHLHSEYSLLDGACRIADIPRAAKAAGHTAVALTDHGVMYGAVAFYRACKEEGIKPIIGCEVYLSPGSRFDRVQDRGSSYFHLVLLCKNETGYRNLIYMVSKGFTEGFYSKPRIDMELLREHSEGLVALSGCLAGFIPRALSSGDFAAADAHAAEMIKIFGRENFFLEIQDHGMEEQKTVNISLRRMAEELGVGLVATNDAHYIKKSDADTQAILMCIQTGNVITDGRPIGFETDEYYYKSTEEMRELFSAYPGAIENTVRIADMCNFDFSFDKIFLPRYTPDNGQSPKDYLRSLAESGLRRRVSDGSITFTDSHPKEEYVSRMDYELDVIESMGYSEYFLVVWDFVNYAKSRGIPVGPGRGSGAGSLVAFLLSITDVDSIKFDLLFERFLNPERVSMPDIDIDFCYNRRDEVIKYVTERYGEDHVCQIITFGTMAARAAVRDVGRALGMPYAEVDTVAKLIPQELGITIAEARERKELKELSEENESVARLIEVAAAIEGMPRHASTHAAGVVITDRPLTEHLPLAVNGDTVVTQFDMDTVAKLGLLKFDFLALRYLTIISDAEREIRKTHPDFDVSKIRLDDSQTFRLISEGRTDGVFQLESGGIRQMLMSLSPESLDDIIAAIALYRPGPMESIPRYIECRHDKSKISYAHPSLEKILGVTYGCIVYQEQVMQVFREVAGYSFGRADIVRRAMSKKKAAELEREQETFISGAVSRGLDRSTAEQLFDDMRSFARYAFNKSHAAAYAVISYRTAYLSAHYPKEYLSALLTSVLDSPGKIAEYIAECGKRGIKVLPPDINESDMNFTVAGDNIRYGLMAIKNVGRLYLESIIAERKGRPFDSFEDFIDRMKDSDNGKRQVEFLIKCGAFDSLGVYRSRLLASYELIIDRFSPKNRGSIAGQIDIFSLAAGDGGVTVRGGYKYPEIPEFSAREKLALEKESAGMYFSGSILDDYSRHLSSIEADSVLDIMGGEGRDGYPDKKRVKIAGVITARVNKNTRNGEGMAFVTLEDRMGTIEAVVFPKVLEKYTELLMQDSAVLIEGTVSRRDADEDTKVLVNTVLPLMTNDEYIPARVEEKPRYSRPETVAVSPAPAVKKGGKLYLKVPSLDSRPSKKAQNLIAIFSGDIPVCVYSEEEKKYYNLTGLSADGGDFLRRELKELLGEENVIMK